MVERALLNRANNVIMRVFALDEVVANASAFRALLQDLHSRDLSNLASPHVAAIFMVRSAILRSAIGTVMACLDPEDRRGNRASVGQILAILQDQTLVAAFGQDDDARRVSVEAYQRAQGGYTALVESDLFNRGRRLRNDLVAHLLIPVDPTPVVPYQDIYDLGDVAEQLTIDLFQVTDRGMPQFPGHQAKLTNHAKIFWDAYFAGMSAKGPTVSDIGSIQTRRKPPAR